MAVGSWCSIILLFVVVVEDEDRDEGDDDDDDDAADGHAKAPEGKTNKHNRSKTYQTAKATNHKN